MKTYTKEQKEQALINAQRSLSARLELEKKIKLRGFAKRGHDKCVHNTRCTIEDLKNDTASSRQIAYWIKN